MGQAAILLAIVLGGGCLQPLADQKALPSPPLDGQQWKLMSVEQRDGFVGGYVDSFIWERRGSNLLFQGALIEYSKAVTRYFAEHPDRLGTSVATILELVAPTVPRASTSGGERYTNRHGIFDGLYWTQAGPQGRLGYIQGFLESEKRDETRGSRFAGRRFSHASEWYVDAIDDWYERDVQRRSSTPVADVLYRLRDGA